LLHAKQGCSAKKISMGRLFPPHYTPDWG